MRAIVDPINKPKMCVELVLECLRAGSCYTRRHEGRSPSHYNGRLFCRDQARQKAVLLH